MSHVAAFEPADHGIRFTAAQGERGDHGGIGSHDGARGVRRYSMASGDIDVGRDKFAVARIVLGIDQREVLARPDREAEAGKPRVDHRRSADQDGQREPLLHHDLRRTQDAFVLALRIDDARGRRLRLGEHRLHDEPGAEHEAVEALGVSGEIRDRPRGDARVHGGARDRRRNAQDEARIERIGNERAAAEQRRLAAIGTRGDFRRRLACERGDRLDGGEFHRFVDGGRAHVEGAAEDIGKAQDVVDLVRVVGAAGADQRVGACLERHVRHDLRNGIGERHDQRPLCHARHHLGLEHAGG